MPNAVIPPSAAAAGDPTATTGAGCSGSAPPATDGSDQSTDVPSLYPCRAGSTSSGTSGIGPSCTTKSSNSPGGIRRRSPST